jgi:hypothetical protein
MDHPITLTNINASFFSSHLLEMAIMLTGTILLSFVAGRMFGKAASNKEKEPVQEEVSVTETVVPAHSTYFSGEEMEQEKAAAQAMLQEKEQAWEEQLTAAKGQLQQSKAESGLLKEEKEILAQQVNQLYDCLKQQLSDLSSIGQFRETIDKQQATMELLQAENKQLQVSLEELRTEQHHQAVANSIIATVSTETDILAEKDILAAQLKQVEQEKEKLAYAVVSLQDQVYALEVVRAEGGSADGESNGSLVKLMEDKVQILQKERNDLMGQISQLENQLKITHLTSLSKVDLDQEEENPIKRLTLYIRMLEGEKQGLNNKIADMSKKLTQAEASMEQIQAKELELTYVKSRLSALEKDKRDVQSQSGEWEVMYKKLHEKTHYLLSAKETELEQLKTTISYLEKDKNRLQGRINDLENELRSSVFNYKGHSPLAFNL